MWTVRNEWTNAGPFPVFGTLADLGGCLRLTDEDIYKGKAIEHILTDSQGVLYFMTALIGKQQEAIKQDAYYASLADRRDAAAARFAAMMTMKIQILTDARDMLINSIKAAPCVYWPTLKTADAFVKMRAVCAFLGLIGIAGPRMI